MERAERLQFYMQMYDFEHEQRKALRSDVGSSITVLVILAGGLFFYVRNLPVLGWHNSQVVFVALLIIASIAVLLALCFMGRAWWDRHAGFLVPPLDLENWWVAIKAEASESAQTDEWASEAFVESLIFAVGEVTRDNRRDNEAIAGAAISARRCMLTALLLLALNLPFYLFCTYHYGKAASVTSYSGRSDFE